MLVHDRPERHGRGGRRSWLGKLRRPQYDLRRGRDGAERRMRAALVVQPLITRPIGTAAGDEVTVAYAWHPWAGRSVRLHEVIERATGASARCGLVDAPPARLQEIPLW